ncbi:unnamed protein product [Hermetia illucens]|uniref:Uncharacterized protein n=1 Tax=Hermetia illucens TaxID=343691 RepID=A0A7R8Z0C9_HERIL|nr:cecropin-like peptide 1 [Hermetia illucens]CAD7090888.1 unnamed protein product [Hermetia illucens]
MTIAKLFLTFAAFTVLFTNQSEADQSKEAFKPMERPYQRVRNAKIQGITIAQNGPNVLAITRGGLEQRFRDINIQGIGIAQNGANFMITGRRRLSKKVPNISIQGIGIAQQGANVLAIVEK